MAKVFKNTVDRDDDSGDKRDFEDFYDMVAGEIGDSGKIEDQIGDGGQKALVETAVVAPGRDVGIDGENR